MSKCPDNWVFAEKVLVKQPTVPVYIFVNNWIIHVRLRVIHYYAALIAIG